MRVPITPSAACGDPFEGRVEPVHVLGLAREVAGSKPDEFVLADTIAAGAIDCEGIIDPVVPFDEAAGAYEQYVDRNPERAVKLGVRF